MCTGSPRLEVLRRLRPVSGRSVNDGPSPNAVLEARHRARAETVPTFTVIRSTKEEPNSVPAASPRLPRSTSPWPPGRHPQDHPGVPPTSTNTAARGTHRTRPISARFGAGKPLRDVEAGSCPYSSPSRSPDPHHLAVLTRPGFVRAAPTRTRHLPGQAALSFTALLRQGRRQKVSHLLLKQQRLTAHVNQG